MKVDDPSESPNRSERTRLRARVGGAVQGVGFRPFVFRLASELGLNGWVSNSVDGLVLEVEGNHANLESFLKRLEADKPPRSVLRKVETEWLAGAGYQHFEIRESQASGSKSTLVLPDIATCPDCLRELFAPANRRYLYPFTNCTHCGPRFTIVEALPYDRANTSMKGFVMCPACQAEYDDPRDRRFHAQPNACPRCGPQLALWDKQGRVLASQHPALARTVAELRAGAIVAIKGLGGFHLAVAADRDDAVQRLRQLKHREEKPFALMFGGLDQVQSCCEVSPLEKELLCSAPAPILLLRRGDRVSNKKHRVSHSVAPGNPYLGVMLPYTPLHHILMHRLGFPIVATSGNLSEEPICIDEHEVVERLGGMADFFLVHNRPIVRHADDSVVRVMAGRELVLRRGRGYAPLPVPVEGGKTVLAVGAHLKNTVSLAIGPEAFLSQHIGDLETTPAYTAFQKVIADFQQFYEAKPDLVAIDAHPDYLSTRYGKGLGLPVVEVQHHYAHILSCVAEHELEPDVLGVSWDGTGYGTDGTIWGGEFLVLTPTGFERLAHLRTFRLPGGDRAVREPRRSALGLLYERFGDAAFDMPDFAYAWFSDAELRALRKMLAQGLNAPVTSSAGRLFDGVAALLGLRQRSAFEGQAAMDLEFVLEGFATEESYPFILAEGCAEQAMIIDWGPMLDGILKDLQNRSPAGLISMKFHNSLVKVIVRLARAGQRQQVVLSGGCFQNKYLTERAVARLQQAGFRPSWHRLVPPNDGGIALGQVLAARRKSRTEYIG